MDFSNYNCNDTSDLIDREVIADLIRDTTWEKKESLHMGEWSIVPRNGRFGLNLRDKEVCIRGSIRACQKACEELIQGKEIERDNGNKVPTARVHLNQAPAY